MPLHYQPFRHYRQRDGRCSAKMEELWQGVRAWAQRHGFEYADSYGVVGVNAA